MPKWRARYRAMRSFPKRAPRYGIPYTRVRYKAYGGGRSRGGIGGKAENKVHTVDFLGVSPLQSTAPTVLNLVSGGTASTNRIGDTMIITSIQLRACMRATATSVNSCYRLMIIYDRQPNKAIASLDDIFVGGAPHGPMDYMELDNRKRFSVVYNSDVFAIGANTNDNDNRVLTFFCKARAETVWSDSSGVIGSLTTGSLLLVHISDRSASAEVANMDFQVRIRFTDGQYDGPTKFFQKKFNVLTLN